jgi:protein-L-isoaspartate(D-aspartate) O-methyltransferase
VHVGDGWLGLPEHAPYGGIAVAAAAPRVPAALWDQLAVGARIVLPVGSRRRQDLCAIERTPGGPRLILTVPARFVPLVSGAG